VMPWEDVCTLGICCSLNDIGKGNGRMLKGRK